MSNRNRVNNPVNKMNSPTAALAALLLACASFPASSAAGDLSGAATLTSQYIYRGRDMSDGDPALQFALDYDFDNGLFAGAWASTIDLENRFGERDKELMYYVGYRFASDAPVSVSTSLLRYTYPDQTAARSYAYNEAVVAALFKERYSIEFGYASRIYGSNNIGRYAEARAEWPATKVAVVSAGVGRKDIESLGTPAYLYWDLGASVRYSRFMFDLRWHDNEDVAAVGRRLTGSRIVVSLTALF